MADPALAHPAAAHPELADPAPWPRLRRRPPRRLYARSTRSWPPSPATPVSSTHRCAPPRRCTPCAPCRRASRSGPTTTSCAPGPWCWRPARAPYRPFRASPTPSLRRMTTLTALTYRDPSQLPDGGVLVVGASATGVQLAGEIHRSGRPVTLAVGEHVRLPRTYRARDIFWWLEATGLLAERYDQIDDLTRARHLPSPQLTGTPRATIDRPQHAHGARGPHRGPPRPHRRRHGPVLRVPRQHLRARRPEDEPVPEPGRPVGHRRGPRRRAPATAPLRSPPASIPARPWSWT